MLPPRTTPVDAHGAGNGNPSVVAETTSAGKIVRQIPAAVVAPRSCDTMYAAARPGVMRPVTRKPHVIAGLLSGETGARQVLGIGCEAQAVADQFAAETGGGEFAGRHVVDAHSLG